ncbi:MAG: nucleotide-diphospho-sugar transferase [Bacteroidia bacterium]
MLETPVLFLIFNRPDVTALVFESIRKVRPKKLFIAADGPRLNKEGEKEKCEQTRKLVLDGIDWDCEIKTLFREKNAGCKYAVSGAITWFFENVEEGIILEDDCLPDESFFYYCSELLEKYRNEPSVMHIGANYYNTERANNKDTYYFSSYIEIWGWATWRRAWKLYDPEMRDFPKLSKTPFLQTIFKTEPQREYWMNCFNSSFESKVDTWDYQWVFCVYSHSGIAINPYTNLVSNLGFRDDATHTTSDSSAFSNIKSGAITKLVHHGKIEVSWKDDTTTFNHIYQPKKTGFKNNMMDMIKKNKLLYNLYKKFKH